jgi:hypothetical protein
MLRRGDSGESPRPATARRAPVAGLRPSVGLGDAATRLPAGFSVDASVRIEGEDRAGIERLVRYCARPPFALERLHTLEGSASLTSPESRLLYRFPKPDVNGRTEILLTPLELLERLARFVPPGHPRAAWVACTATVTTASSRRTRRCAPKSSRSVGPISGPSPPSPAPRPPHPA